jgi:DNA repair protein RecO (recombination protein O)
MHSRDRLEQAFVLHRRDYANTSLLIEVFSGPSGRFAAIAKGAKRGRSPTAVLLQPFTPLWLSWSGRGEVRTLARVEAAGAALTLPGKAVYCGFYLNELLMRLLGRHDPHEDLFAFYHAALARLALGTDLEAPLRQFELRLLQDTGYALDLEREWDTGRPVVAGRRYRYEPERGMRAATSPEEGLTVSGEALLALAAGEALSGVPAREARGLMRAALAPYLGPRPLRSRELFQQSGGASKAPPLHELNNEDQSSTNERKSSEPSSRQDAGTLGQGRYPAG